MKEPSTLKHLKTFLQTCSWFRKFIPNFSKVAEPLTRLTRKNQIWIWGAEQTQAFNELKRLLTSAPILVQPDFNQPFTLRTDASNYALGAVLLQGDGNQERPIEYASRLLNAAERNYGTVEREALAVVWAVERFRPYIDGHPVVIGSDHQPLRWLLSLKSPAGRLVRWALKIQSFDIKFQYTPGKANVVADTLSRPICSENSRAECGICSVICDLPTKTPTQIRQEQISDPEVEKIIKEIEGTEDVAAERWLKRGYLMDQGVLFRYNPDSESESPQLVVPAGQIVDILKKLHDSPTAGHPGIDRTYHKVAQLYYFTGMRRIITDYVKACIHCQRYKATNAKPPGLLQTPVMNQRSEVLAIDLFGPLPEGDQGERWILLVEDTATRWTELYALQDATAEACARILIEEYFMRFGLPRRIISDNGVQFVSAVMRKCMLVMDIKQNFVPLYHPEANPAERKNRDLKAMLAYLVESNHASWPKMLPLIINGVIFNALNNTHLTAATNIIADGVGTSDQHLFLWNPYTAVSYIVTTVNLHYYRLKFGIIHYQFDHGRCVVAFHDFCIHPLLHLCRHNNLELCSGISDQVPVSLKRAAAHLLQMSIGDGNHFPSSGPSCISYSRFKICISLKNCVGMLALLKSPKITWALILSSGKSTTDGHTSADDVPRTRPIRCPTRCQVKGQKEQNSQIYKNIKKDKMTKMANHKTNQNLSHFLMVGHLPDWLATTPGLKYVAITTLSCVPALVTRFQSPLREQQRICSNFGVVMSVAITGLGAGGTQTSARHERAARVTVGGGYKAVARI
ncbi:hypothetical protein K1T71_014630 [Dendrolimus kikuchii]|uniref:Uncharacterized protein n=1 Tax=Dendrolimus kikuchii TaxID=765133 RepID=A0ACC1CEK9_9NEOP|nr:hypothetical protein K1T71_014630 [Dendrolimus kikuchii]